MPQLRGFVKTHALPIKAGGDGVTKEALRESILRHLDQERGLLKAHVRVAMSDDCLERGEDSKGWPRDLKELHAKNDEIIDGLTPEKLRALNALRRLVEADGDVHICDKESMVVMPASGFVWSMQEELVIVCER
jgi:hypothetical protein